MHGIRQRHLTLARGRIQRVIKVLHRHAAGGLNLDVLGAEHCERVLNYGREDLAVLRGGDGVEGMVARRLCDLHAATGRVEQGALMVRAQSDDGAAYRGGRGDEGRRV